MDVSGVEDEFRLAADRGMDAADLHIPDTLFQRPEAPDPDR